MMFLNNLRLQNIPEGKSIEFFMFFLESIYIW